MERKDASATICTISANEVSLAANLFLGKRIVFIQFQSELSWAGEIELSSVAIELPIREVAYPSRDAFEWTYNIGEQRGVQWNDF